MSHVTTGFAPCEKGARYVQQLVKHWAHKFDTTFEDGMGTVPFSEATRAKFTARENGIDIRLETPGAEEAERMQGVIERHLDRFAFREVPLAYEWSAA